MRASAVLTTLATVLAGAPAQAYICSRAVDSLGEESGPSLSWFTRNLSYALHEDGTADVAAKDEMNVLRASFRVWEGVQECAPPGRVSDITFTEAAELTGQELVGFNFLSPLNNSNTLVFRDQDWPHRGQGNMIIALTTTTYSAQSGEILDADIEFNAANFEFTINDPPGAITDLMNTAVHEIGHILGLGHSSVPDSTMEATARDGEVNKRTLECDDRDGLVFKYPAAADNGYCAEPTCAVGLSECGTCTVAACQPWAACGYCAPPRPLENITAVTVVGFDDGNGGCGCNGSGGAAAAVVAGLFALRRRRRYSGSVSS